MIPCLHNPPGGTKGCRHCLLWNTQPRQREAWGGPKAERRTRDVTPQRLNAAPNHSYTYAPDPTDGPGTELKGLLLSLGLQARGCACEDRVRMMNAWGPALCRANRDDIADWLRTEAGKRSWRERLVAGVTAATHLAGELNLLDPYGSLVDLALRRYEERTRAR